jgi:alpha-methylacyl-CoA racemase
MNPETWPEMKEELARIFKTKTRDEWDAIFEGTDACVTPVLSLEEAADHPHNVSRGLYAKTPVLQPMPGPRFSRTPGAISAPPSRHGQHTREALKDWGIPETEIDRLQSAGAIGADEGPR